MNSLSQRLFLAFLGVIAIVLTSVSLALLVLLRNNPLVERQAFARLHTVSTVVVRQALLGSDSRPADLRRVIGEIALTYDARVLLTQTDGTVLMDSADGAEPGLELRRFRAAQSDTAFPEAVVGTARDNRLRVWLYVARPILGDRMLVVAGRPPGFSALLYFSDNLLWPLIQAAGLAALVSGLLAILIARGIARPLQKMAGVAQGIAHGNYSQAAPETGPEEVRALAEALNSMARQVQANTQSQRDFLANVSHELRTPLTSIQGFAQAILDGAAESPAALNRSATIIHSEADRMRRLVENLLGLARLEASLHTLAQTPGDLRAVLEAVIAKFEPQAAANGVILLAELPPALPSVTGDGDRLAQVFTNLIDNALKHTPSSGRVTVRSATVGGQVSVSVADTGPGIPLADQARVFERFYQVDKARARGAGVGLGLAISKEIVEAHGGRLSVESRPGTGAIFTVSLPAGKA